jgi:hypothetical protein
MSPPEKGDFSEGKGMSFPPTDVAIPIHVGGIPTAPVPTLTEYEWRLTYDIGDGAGGVIREGFGLDEKGARAALARYEANPDITELKLWRRPKPAKWECANGL